ncbi:DUF4386 domain-containing protein [Georgenia sp. AZ-5]|uniref:DUF4386 domain-containing protein n=1 Tax=Georgenia sp. AZ-5 TaxID=3367526 RepID=UPI0037548F4C
MTNAWCFRVGRGSGHTSGTSDVLFERLVLVGQCLGVWLPGGTVGGRGPNGTTGAGPDPTASVALGAVLELILIIANVGTAVVPYAVFKRYSEGLALGYVAARLVEGTFVAIGIISLLAFLFMRQEGTAATDLALGEAFVAIYDRAFLIGPGFFAGVANGMILGYLMYRSGLVPRGMAMLGLIGGPLVAASGVAVMFDVIERGSALQGVATIPEFIWELSFGIYLIVKGFKPSPILAGVDSGPAGGANS